MKTQLESLSPIKKRLKIEVLPDSVNQAREEAVAEVQKHAKLAGFRPGKVPRKIIEEKFLHELQKVTIEKIVDKTLIEALQQVNVRPVSRPEIEPGLWGAAGGFSYQAVFEVLPEIVFQEKDYQGLQLEKEEIEIQKEEIDQEIERLRGVMTQLEPLSPETPLQKGFVAIIDYQGKVDGKSFKDGEAKDFAVEVGAGGLLKDFEEGLLGAKQNEKRSITFAYPPDYFNKELAGKKGEFQVTLKSVRKKNVPELNDDFAKDLGNYKDMEAVRAELSKRLALIKEQNQKNELFDQIIKQLVEKQKFEVPDGLVENELNHLVHELAKDLASQGKEIRELNAKEVIDHLKPNAEFRVRSFLSLNSLSQTLKVDVAEAQIEERLAAVARGASRPLAEIKAYYEKNRLIGPLKTRMLHEKALEIVLNESKIKTKKAKSDKKGPK